MKKLFFISIACLLLSLKSLAGVSDVYLVFYATYKGKTGHVGIAVDNYKIVFTTVDSSGVMIEQADTLANGELTYYDLWPDDDYFNITRTGKDIPAQYYKLPASTTEEITVSSLYDKGIPHRENYACDGLLKICSNWQQDKQLKSMLDSMVNANRSFNARRFNCSNFVQLPLQKLLNKQLSCKEFVFTGWSATPNKLYRKLRATKQVVVLKNADKKATGSFIGQRVFYKIFQRNRNSNQ